MSTLYSLASHVARIAGAEWQRACESVKRFSPTVGPLGEWRAHCEGGWAGAMPEDLPDEPDETQQRETSYERNADDIDIRDRNAPAERSAPEYSLRAATSSGKAPSLPQYLPVGDHVGQNLSGFDKGHTGDHHNDRQRQRRHPFAALASFPSPPSHVPIPNTNSYHLDNNNLNVRPQAFSPSGTSLFELQPESTILGSTSHTPALTSGSISPPLRRESPTPLIQNPAPRLSIAASQDGGDTTYSRLTNPYSSVSAQGDNDDPPHVDNSDLLRESPIDAEFGLRPRLNALSESSFRDAGLPQTESPIQNDTKRSNASIVAALRDRYARGPVCTHILASKFYVILILCLTLTLSLLLPHHHAAFLSSPPT